MNQFRRYWDLGFTSIIPVIPPDAKISEGSTLFKRIGTHQDGRGKTPGIKGRNGNWFSFDWVPYLSDETDVERWAAMGASVGIRTGNGLVAIDADAPVAEHAQTILQIIKEHLGEDMPIRVGRYPKALYLCRVTDPYNYTMFEFGERDATGNAARVEILSDGKQFVAEGIHPKTGKPYSWPKDIVPYADLPLYRPEQLDALMEALRSALPKADPKLKKEGHSGDVNQDSLRGDVETIRKAVKATPNTTALFPSRESYRDFGYAIKAALPDNEDEAFDIWADWCDRWEDQEHHRQNDADIYAADWKRMKGPYRIGASYIFNIATQTSQGAFSTAQAFFEPVAPSPSAGNQNSGQTLFDIVAEQEREEEIRDVYPLARICDLFGRKPAKFLIGRHIPQGSLGFMYSAPGVGKSFVALDMSLTIAHALADWHGEELNINGDGSVLYIASEGSFDLPVRIGAWLTARGIDQVTDKFYVLEASVNFMQAESVDKLVRSAQALNIQPALIVVDTVSRALPGADENLQKDMTLFINACERLQHTFGSAVMGLHHTAKSGAMRGSSVIEGAGDFVIHLERDKGATYGSLHMFKQKAAPDGWSYQLNLAPVSVEEKFLPKAFWEERQDWASLVFEKVDDAEVGDATSIGPDVGADMRAAIAAAWVAGAPLSMAPQARERFAPKALGARFGMSAASVEKLLKAWLQAGVLDVRCVSTHSRVKGLYVMAGAADDIPVMDGSAVAAFSVCGDVGGVFD